MTRRHLRLLWFLPIYAVVVMMISWTALVALLADDFNGFLDGAAEVFLEPAFWFYILVPATGLLVLQGLILWPVLSFRLARAERGKSLLASVLLLAVFASAITFGLVFGLWELQLIVVHDRVEVGDERMAEWLWWVVLLVSWLFWTVVFWRFTRRPRRPEDRIGRLIGLIIGGSIAEMALIIPIDIMVRRRTDCYCNTGTFFALGFSMMACIWLAGPGAFVALTGKRRRAWYQGHCEACGYERGPTPGPRCPECGEVWEVVQSTLQPATEQLNGHANGSSNDADVK